MTGRIGNIKIGDICQVSATDEIMLGARFIAPSELIRLASEDAAAICFLCW